MARRILVSNDDGVYTPGIAALAQAAAEFGEVRVVAPDVEMSSAGSAITSSRPLTVKHTPLSDIDAYRVNGTPADCVALGTTLWEGVDIVLSGVNLGSNVGHGIWHSGTVAAAKQAALMGIRGIALSIPAPEEQPDFERLRRPMREVLEALLPDDTLSLVNVNFPHERPKGMMWTRQSVRLYDGKVMPGKDPLGRQHYWFMAMPVTETDEGTDRWALEQGYISITPLRIDLTDEEKLAAMQSEHPLRRARSA